METRDNFIVKGYAFDAEFIVNALKQNYKRVKQEIERLHSYENPFVGSLKISEINGPYYQYLKKNVKRYYGKRSAEAKPNLKNPSIKEKKS